MIMEQNNNKEQILVRPEFDKLKIQLTKINEIALEIQQRQIRIINTANLINNKLKSSIDRRFKIKKIEKEKDKKENIKESSKSTNYIKRFSDIRNFYKSKNIHKNIDIGEMNDANKENINRNCIF